jgi:hypothetical protein
MVIILLVAVFQAGITPIFIEKHSWSGEATLRKISSREEPEVLGRLGLLV